MNKNLVEIEERMNTLAEDGREEIVELQKKIDMANESREQLAEDYLVAKEKLDTKAYAKISSEMRSLKDIVGLYEDKVEQLKATPDVSESEYEEIKESIIQTLKAEDEKALVKVNKLLEEADSLREELNENIGKGNTLLRHLQRNVFKEPKIIEKQDATGRIIKSSTLDNKYNSDVNTLQKLNKMLHAK